MIAREILKNIKQCVRNRQKRKYFHYSEEMLRNSLERWYYKQTGFRLDLDNPKRYTEKLQWMKLYDSTPLKAELTDKLTVRDWVSRTIGGQYLIPLLGQGNSLDDIDFSQLPDSFVLKANHACDMNILVKDKRKLNIFEAKLKFARWLSTNYAFEGFELHYGMIRPKVIVEKHMGENINEYKFMCFDGKPEFVFVQTERKSRLKIMPYDMDWNEIPFRFGHYERSCNIKKSQNFDLMVCLAKKLSAGFTLVRVDFYEVGDCVYFSEMTFTPGAGRVQFFPGSYDFVYGDKIKLPQKKEIPLRQIREIWGKRCQATSSPNHDKHPFHK